VTSASVSEPDEARRLATISVVERRRLDAPPARQLSPEDFQSLADKLASAGDFAVANCDSSVAGVFYEAGVLAQSLAFSSVLPSPATP
jgi:hypothetical protein